MSTKNRTRRTTTRNIRFPNQMIEQINIALEQKGSGNFSAWVIEAYRRRLTSEKRAYTSIKSDDGWTSRFLPPSHRKSDYEGNPASVSTVKPGVHRFWLFPQTHAEGVPRQVTVIVNAGDSDDIAHRNKSSIHWMHCIDRSNGVGWTLGSLSPPANLQRIILGRFLSEALLTNV